MPSISIAVKASRAYATGLNVKKMVIAELRQMVDYITIKTVIISTLVFQYYGSLLMQINYDL